MTASKTSWGDSWRSASAASSPQATARRSRAASARHYAELLSLRRRILSRSPDSALFRSDLIAALSAHAEGQVAEGLAVGGLDALNEAIEVADALVDEVAEAYHQRSAATVRRRAAEVERIVARDAAGASRRSRLRRGVSLLEEAVQAMDAIAEPSERDAAVLAEIRDELRRFQAELRGS